jgi:hypothetical protein
MKLINTKLVLSALGIALLATPALAQQQTQPLNQGYSSNAQSGYGWTQYPNPQTHSGSAMSRDSGNDSIGGTD